MDKIIVEDLPKSKKPFSKMNNEERKKKIEEIHAIRKSLLEKQEELMNADPFWFFKPHNGTINQQQKMFLEKWLKPEDIPQRLVGQTDVFASKSPINFVCGGNQSGKSLTGVIKRLIKATGLVPNSLKDIFPMETIIKKTPRLYRVVAEDYTNGLMKNILPAYQKWTPRECLIDGSWEKSFSVKENVLTLVLDGKIVANIEFMSNSQDVETHQGPARDGCDFDEEPRYEIYKEDLMRLTTSEFFDINFYETPTHGMSWVYDKIYTKEADEYGNKIQTFSLSSVCNPKANLKVLDEIMKGIDSYEERRMRLLGEFVSLSGLVYGKLFDPMLHVIEPFPVNCQCGGTMAHSDDCPYTKFFVVRGIDPHLVTPTAVVYLAVDREDNHYVVTSYFKDKDIQEVKDDQMELSKGMRIGWSRVDASSDSTIKALNDRNIFIELSRGKNAIPALFKSEKYQGSIRVGVDEIKQRLKINEKTNKPRLFIFNVPENKELIHSFKTLERDTYANEDQKGMKDKIAEGKHHLHAALRYIYQGLVRWMPCYNYVPNYEEINLKTGY